MDRILRDTMFAGLSDYDIGEAIAVEMRRRGLYGCLFMFPAQGKGGTFVSSSPANTIADFSTAEQLVMFAEVAKLSTGEKRTKLTDELDATDWMN